MVNKNIIEGYEIPLNLRIEATHENLVEKCNLGKAILSWNMKSLQTFKDWYNKHVSGNGIFSLVQDGTSYQGVPIYTIDTCMLLNQNESLSLVALIDLEMDSKATLPVDVDNYLEAMANHLDDNEYYAYAKYLLSNNLSKIGTFDLVKDYIDFPTMLIKDGYYDFHYPLYKGKPRLNMVNNGGKRIISDFYGYRMETNDSVRYRLKTKDGSPMKMSSSSLLTTSYNSTFSSEIQFQDIILEKV